MPVNYSIELEIKSEFNYESIKNILSKAHDLGIKYYRENEDTFYYEEINFDSAIARILNIDKIYDLNKIRLEIDNETYAELLCNQYYKHQLSLWLTSLFKSNEDDLELFLAQYTKVLLYMTQDFPFIRIDVSHNKYPVEEFNHTENKFFLRTETLNFNKFFFKQIIRNAIKYNILLDKNHNQIIDKLSDEIYYSLLNKFEYILKFKIDEEEGDLIFHRSSHTFEEIMEKTDFFENRKDDWKISMDITLKDLKYSWIKKFPDGTEALDLAKYAKLMLNLVDRLELIELKVEIINNII